MGISVVLRSVDFTGSSIETERPLLAISKPILVHPLVWLIRVGSWESALYSLSFSEKRRRAGIFQSQLGRSIRGFSFLSADRNDAGASVIDERKKTAVVDGKRRARILRIGVDVQLEAIDTVDFVDHVRINGDRPYDAGNDERVG